jgi:hypothetical protein
MSNLIVISIAGFPAKKLQIAANLVETRTQQDLGSGLFDSVRTNQNGKLTALTFWLISAIVYLASGREGS